MKLIYPKSTIYILAFLHLTSAVPTTKQTSAKSFYLLTCTDGLDRPTYDAVAYFSAPPNSIIEDSPDEIVEIDAPARSSDHWGGLERRIEIDGGVLATKIASNGQGLATNEIAGGASFGKEDFVCFRSSGKISKGRLDGCEALFWCAAVE